MSQLPWYNDAVYVCTYIYIYYIYNNITIYNIGGVLAGTLNGSCKAIIWTLHAVSEIMACGQYHHIYIYYT